jgi:hypothetical protein
LGVHEQKVFYHIRRLKRSGLIEVVREERKKGAVCKYFSPTCGAFGIEIPGGGEQTWVRDEPAYRRVRDFFHEFVKEGTFGGSIIVGSPTPHGPFLTAARDGHYAVQLAMFLGNFCELAHRFIVKLDTQVKAEGAKRRNMILIGGPITNMITSEVNDKLRMRFRWREGWKIYSEPGHREYTDEDMGLIAKVKNPWDGSKVVIVLAGLRFEGTKSCVIAITQHFEKLLEKYERGRDFYTLIRGLDRDGDGRVDDIDFIEMLT